MTTGIEASHAKGSILFAADQKAYGVYVILDGRAKLSLGSAHGKSLILGFFGPGAILGLAGTILGRPYGATAESVKLTRAALVPRDDLLRHLGTDAEAAFHTAELLSEMCYSILSEMEIISLSGSAEQRLARFLVELCEVGEGSERQTRLDLGMGHSDIAQMIGVSRETVTRVLSRFKKRNIVSLRRSVLAIRDKAGLAKLAEFSGKTSPPFDAVRPIRRRDVIPVTASKA